MARRPRNPFPSRSFQRTLGVWTRTALRVGSRAVTQALRSAPGAAKNGAGERALARKRVSARKQAAKSTLALAGKWSSGLAVGAAGARRYRLFEPPGLSRNERLPLLVMLHGCGQDAQELAASSRMNRVATRARFLVLYPEQDRLSNAQRCWNWYDTRSGRAQGEASVIEAAITQVCLRHGADPRRIALAGLSAGASMAALLATRHPERFCAVVMHSGVAPGVAHSSATALGAMRGRRNAVPLGPLAAGTRLPPLLVIHGSADPIVAPGNAVLAASQWAACAGATAGAPRTVQRGARYTATLTDYHTPERRVATVCMVNGLGHAWSGGADHHAYSDPRGPDASRMIRAFVAKQFAGDAA